MGFGWETDYHVLKPVLAAHRAHLAVAVGERGDVDALLAVEQLREQHAALHRELVHHLETARLEKGLEQAALRARRARRLAHRRGQRERRREAQQRLPEPLAEDDDADERLERHLDDALAEER